MSELDDIPRRKHALAGDVQEALTVLNAALLKAQRVGLKVVMISGAMQRDPETDTMRAAVKLQLREEIVYLRVE